MTRIPNVLLDIEKDRGYGRDLIKGIARYSRHFGPWIFEFRPPFYLRSESKEKTLE